MSTKSVARLSSIPDSREWKSFFIDAGIPAAESATYALTFAQNRIQSDMLVNINKDYLQEMGIKLIGDIIAILRHSRRVHDELQRRTIMKSSAANPPNQPVVPQSKVVSQTAIVQAKKVSETKSVTRIQKYNDTEMDEEEEEEEEEDEEEDEDFSDDDDDDDDEDVDVDVQKKVESQPEPIKKKPPSIVSKAVVNRPSVVAARPLQKVPRRNPPPVSDGPLVTVRVTEKPKTLISKKMSVFTRLGDKVEKLEKPPVKITMRMDVDPVESQTPHSSNASSLPYVGILKNKRLAPRPAPIVSKTSTKKIPTMRADEEQKRPAKRAAISWVTSDAKVQKMNVKDRLGGVKNRLGSVNKVNEKPIQVKTLGSTTPRIPIVYSDSEVSSSKKVSFGPVQKKEFDSYVLNTGRFRVGWSNS